METRCFRITWKDWKMLRKLIPGLKKETCARYMNRVVNSLDYYSSREK
jgi:hypothetical protein